MPDWLPVNLINKWNNTDLTYDYFLKLCGQLEAIKREKFPEETIVQWFIEFVRRGWTQKMLQQRYDALLSTKIYGIEKLEIADWINAVETFARDEVNLMIGRKIDSMIERGRYLKDKKFVLSEEDKKCIDLAEAESVRFRRERDYWEKRENYQAERRKYWEAKFQ